MRQYRIAFFTADWNYELVESTLQGLKKYVDDHANVHLCVFDCFGKDQDTPADKSEYAIYNLPDLTQFDGALIQGSQIVLERVRVDLARRLKAVGFPVVTIDCPIEGCTMVGIDNKKSQYDIADHVLSRHGAKRVVYLTGLLENGCAEGQDRLDGFWEACRDHQIPEENIEVIPCTWRTSDGADVARKWIGDKRPLPDAFISANDEMALGLIEVLDAAGVRVPQDVIVTGFDGVSSAELSTPRLSTIRRDNARLNYAAMDVLIGKIDQTEKRAFVPFGHELICSESCGCGELAQPSYIRSRYFHQTRFLKNFYTLQDDMAEELFETSDLLELMDIVEHNRRILGCDHVYLCVNDFYFDNFDKKKWPSNNETFGKEAVLASCRCGKPGADRENAVVRFPTKELLPGNLTKEHRFLVFYPLHYNTYSIGFIAMDDISEAAKLNLHKSIFSFLEIAIENVRKKCLLQQFNEILDDLYVHDGLTGLFNRFGYERYAQKTFEAFLEADGGAQILFIDMDGLKSINDLHGHETGDAAIRGSAQVLVSACDKRDFIMRYGGDEFLVIASIRETALEEKILRALDRFNREEHNPFELRLSMGLIRAEKNESRTLEECVQAADALMYGHKNERKRRLS